MSRVPEENENTGGMLDEGTRCSQARSVKSTWVSESWRQTSDPVRGDGSMQASGSVQGKAAGRSVRKLHVKNTN